MSSITNTSHSWPLVTTISLTDFVIVIDERITTTSTPLSADEKTSPVTIAISNNEGHSGIPYQLFPFLSVFAIIGIITVLVALGFLGYRFYRSDRRLVHHNDGGTSGGGRRNSNTVRRESDVPWTEAHKVKSPTLTRFIRKWQHREQEPPISATFIPMATSPMTLVPRWEIWRDPQRRRGIDALDLWERKNTNVCRSSHPSSERALHLESQKQPESTVHVSMARNALETTRCENKSEEWYH